MQIPERPENEERRLRTLRSLDVLDTLPEDRFDRLTRLAKRMFDVPIALVSLVDENRQWFKSCIGLPVLETSRDVSFCGHTILGDEIFLIPDATKDKRFVDNPLVTGEPHIRFYAGCPLQATDGSKLGTLCIIDEQPRNLTAEDLDALRDLEAMVEGELAAVELANRDELTEISNRRGFVMLAEHGLHICIRQSLPACLVFFDLDDFKHINDNFGHAEGDKALVGFSRTMEESFRDSDLIARIGGDEFALLQINTTQEAAQAAVERFKTNLDDFNPRSNSGYKLSCSSGLVEFCPKLHKSLEDLMSDGDSLMYIQKHGARKLNA